MRYGSPLKVQSKPETGVTTGSGCLVPRDTCLPEVPNLFRGLSDTLGGGGWGSRRSIRLYSPPPCSVMKEIPESNGKTL